MKYNTDKSSSFPFKFQQDLCQLIMKTELLIPNFYFRYSLLPTKWVYSLHFICNI